MSSEHDRKNVLIVNQLEVLYGAEMSLLELARALRRVHPVVLSAGGGALQAALERHGLTTVGYDFRRNPSRTKEELASCLHEILEEHEVDIVHLNKPHLNTRPRLRHVEALRRLTRERRIPMVAHVRSVESPLDVEQARLLAEMDKIVCVSQRTKDELLQQEHAAGLRAREGEIAVIYNGRTIEDYEFCDEKRRRMRERLRLDDDTFVVGLVARFCPTKGQDRFVQLAARFRDDGGVRFLLVGDLMQPSDAVYRERIRRDVEERRLESRVLFTGYLESTEIMSGLDVVLSASQTEGLPGVVIEAMAARRCVVANSVGGVPEIVGDDGAGFCVETNDLDAMEGAIRRLQQDRRLVDATGERAFARVKALFTSSRYGEEMTRVYESL